MMTLGLAKGGGDISALCQFHMLFVSLLRLIVLLAHRKDGLMWDDGGDGGARHSYCVGGRSGS